MPGGAGPLVNLVLFRIAKRLMKVVNLRQSSEIK